MDQGVNFSTFDKEKEGKNPLKEEVIEFIQTFAVFAAIGLVVYKFIAQPHRVDGISMIPNFQDANLIITDKVTYHFREPKRGEIIVFQNPKKVTEDFIKRIIALPGDKIKIEKSKIYVNDKELDENYLPEGTITEGKTTIKEGQELTVPENSYIVMGDNRMKSSDSREWGYIYRNEIVGRVLLRYWPVTEFSVYPETYQYKNI